MPWYDNVFTRTFGAGPYVLDPFVKGYGFCYLDLPSELVDSFGGDSSLSVRLAALSRSVSGLGNITLDTEAIEGLGGIKFNVPTKLTMPDRVSIEYMEVDEAFVFNLHKAWINMIRDIRYGASNMIGEDYTKAKYSGMLYIWFTKPDCTTLQEGYVLTGVFPVTLPLDALGFNVSDVAKVDLTIDYVFDHFYSYRKGLDETYDIVRTMFENKLGQLINQVKQRFENYSNNFGG